MNTLLVSGPGSSATRRALLTFKLKLPVVYSGSAETPEFAKGK